MHLENLGDYQIQRLLGEGAFGQVYLAQHRFIKQMFAIKVLPEDFCSDGAFLHRFEEQVSSIAALDHSHILKIHNVSHADGKYFLVSDPIIDSLGETMHLGRYLQLKGKSLSEFDCESILRQVASALDYAHEQVIGHNALFHGALKLTNLLVTPKGEDIHIFLSDFSLTRLIGERFHLLRLSEQIAHSIGSEAIQSFVQAFGFLAPEQKEGGESDLRVDAYSFGVLAYFLLTHKMPEGCFDLPSKLFPGAKGNWDYLVAKCMQPNPQQRPTQLMNALEECLKTPRVATEDMLSLSEIEPKIDHVVQMAFEFAASEEALMAAAEESHSTAALKPVLRPPEIVRPEYESDPGAIFHRDLTVSHYVPKKVEIREVEPLLSEMVIIPAGSYFRGSNEGARDEMPRHPVSLSSFAMDIHPVTNEQFVRFLQAMGGEKDRNNNDIIRLRDARIKRNAGKLVIESGYAKHPVVGVTWYGAVAYAKWVGKRLPREAEWEVASTGGKDLCIYPTGDDIERSQANFFSSDTTVVTSYPPNELGLFDVAGNVYEWCQDWYAYNYYDASLVEPEDPQGPPQGVYRVLRGGCWKSLKEDLRCSHRHRNNPGAVNGTYGFRCAADVSYSETP